MTETKLDKKFYGELRKVKDDSQVPDEEYVVFLAKDDAFAMTLPTYLRHCRAMHADAVQIKMVEDLIQRVFAWRAAHPDQCKVPDAAGETVLS